MISVKKSVYRNWRLYVMLILPLTYIVIFSYVPMYGVTIAFKDFSFRKGIIGSPWIGFENFRMFFNSRMFNRVISNSMYISLYGLIAGFPIPILLALALNEVRAGFFKRSVQMVTYAPYFISTVDMVSMIQTWLAPRTGFVNLLLTSFGFEAIDFLSVPSMFSSILVWTDIWQGAGWGSIIYLAALSAVDPQLYDAARIDGASRVQKAWHIDIPSILPTVTILLIMDASGILSVGFQKVFLLQNDMNLRASEVISTYVYKVGIQNQDYGFSTAIGLFNSIISFVLLVIVNAVARKVSSTSLF